MWIFGALGVLLAVYLGVQLSGSGTRPAGDGPRLGASVPADLALIRASGPGGTDTVRLERRADGWTVNGYPADTSLLRRGLTDMEAAAAGRLVARSPSNHARLGVAEGGSRLVEIGTEAAPSIAFHLGGSGREGRYIRLPGEPAVYVVAAEAVGWLDRTEDEWRDKTITAVDTGSVRKLVVRRRSEEFAVTLVEADSATRWMIDDAVADSATVARMLETVSDLRASGFPTDSLALAADFEHPDAVLDLYEGAEASAVGSVPSVSLVFVGLEESGDFLVRRADRPLMYRLSSWTVQRLVPARKRLAGGE
jgi:hypothetical protein